MSSFLECRREISFYIKELTFCELDERVFSFFPVVANCLSALFLSYEFFSIPQRYFTPTGRDVYFLYRAESVSRYKKIYPQWFALSFVRKNKYTDTD